MFTRSVLKGCPRQSDNDGVAHQDLGGNQCPTVRARLGAFLCGDYRLGREPAVEATCRQITVCNSSSLASSQPSCQQDPSPILPTPQRTWTFRCCGSLRTGQGSMRGSKPGRSPSPVHT